MIYKFDKRILDNYMKKKKPDEEFYGYILPDGSLYKVKDHNVSNIASAFYLILDLLKDDIEAKNKLLLDVDLSNPLRKLLVLYFMKMSHDEVCAFNRFINETSISFSDILVGYFKCHKISRFDKEIMTSVIDNKLFYNYILERFKIRTAPRIVYANNEIRIVDKEYLVNEYLNDEIKKIKEDAFFGEEDLFHK